MAHPYKRQIAALVEHQSWQGLFTRPTAGPVQEHPLKVGNSTGYADFCYELGRSGRLFIEDDDAPRALNNLVKYWRWCLDHPEVRPVHLVHIVGSTSSMHVGHCEFLTQRIEEDLAQNAFRYHLITIDGSWHTPESWLPRLSDALATVAREFGPETAVAL